MAIVNCKLCGKKFDNFVDYEGYRTISTPRPYCSRTCKDRHHNKKPPLNRRHSQRKCPICGKKFDPTLTYDGKPSIAIREYDTKKCKMRAIERRRYAANKQRQADNN